MLNKLPILSALSFLLAYLFTPVTFPLCRAVGAIDVPDGVRKINTHPTPRLGGLAFFAASFLILFQFAGDDAYVAALLSGGAILVAGGFADDSFGFSPLPKLFIQAATALVVIAFIGIPEKISFFGLFTFPLAGAVGYVFVLFRIIFTINAVNFSDGLDGLASGLSIVALVSLSVYGFINYNTFGAVSALVLSAAILGFLPYNRYHAKIFMGDSGSQFLGLAIAVLSLANSPGHNYTLETSLFLAVPTADTALSVIRRLIKRKSPFSADKGHLHHILLNLGIPHPYAVNILVSASALIALFTLLFVI